MSGCQQATRRPPLLKFYSKVQNKQKNDKKNNQWLPASKQETTTLKFASSIQNKQENK